MAVASHSFMFPNTPLESDACWPYPGVMTALDMQRELAQVRALIDHIEGDLRSFRQREQDLMGRIQGAEDREKAAADLGPPAASDSHGTRSPS